MNYVSLKITCKEIKKENKNILRAQYRLLSVMDGHCSKFVIKIFLEL